ncbi:MAG TPA: hypothetical protein VLH59_04775, partial [Ignavibacteriaceae bacterium]|nr:hypothetical protein [Ignavibacteriaceae bacterium]
MAFLSDIFYYYICVINFVCLLIEVLTKQSQKVINNSIKEIRELSLNPAQEFASMVRQFRDKAFQNSEV